MGPAVVPQPGIALLDTYDVALPQVYDYLWAGAGTGRWRRT